MWRSFKVWLFMKYDRFLNPQLVRDYEPGRFQAPIDIDHFEF